MKFLRSGYLYIMSIIASIMPRYVKSASDVGGVKISSDRGSTITKESTNTAKKTGTKDIYHVPQKLKSQKFLSLQGKRIVGVISPGIFVFRD